MREIKFRAWLPMIKEMTQSYTLTELMDWNLNITDSEAPVWMQYTRLNDENGREIYEGDIVRADNLWGERETLEIFWHQNIFGWGAIKYDIDDSVSEILEQDYVCSGLTGYQNFKIIGNIHRNPELLEVPHA